MTAAAKWIVGELWTLGEALAWIASRDQRMLDLTGKLETISALGMWIHAREIGPARTRVPKVPQLPKPRHLLDASWRKLAAAIANQRLSMKGSRTALGQPPIVFGAFPWPDHLERALTFELRDGARAIELGHLDVRWSLLTLRRDEVLGFFPEGKQRAGRKSEFDWADISEFVQQQLDTRGDFNDPLNATDGWRSQNDLIELVKDYMQRTKLHGHGKSIPVDSTLLWRLVAPDSFD